MPSNKGDFTARRASSDSESDEGNADHNSARDQVLLSALRDFILPLAKGTAKKNDISEDPRLESAAVKLIIALREFISNVSGPAHSKEDPRTIEVDLGEDSYRESDISDEDEECEDSDESSSSISSHSDQDSDEPSESGLKDKLHLALRGHIFNKMPIRMLRFKPQGSHLLVSLIEREAIYAHVETIMQVKMNDRSSLRKIKQNGDKESDEEAIDRLISRFTQYAILSHTWLRPSSEEITYDTWNKGLFASESPGYEKLVNFAKIAYTEHKLTLGWMDTLCINKDSSSELDESIRSMYNWYERSEVCIIYLADTGKLSDMSSDVWFTRGWTLQELLAPSVVNFYTRDWKRLAEDSYNDRKNKSITKYIQRAVNISEKELDVDIRCATVSRRMEMAAKRKVTRDEDAAYSLMGIFDVSISIAYGEGAERAFFRLLQKILKSTATGILDVFNWAGRHDFDTSRSYLLPTSPRKYLRRSASVDLEKIIPLEPLTFTHMGLRIPVLLMPGISLSSKEQESKFAAISSIGAYSATVKISPFKKSIPDTYHLLDDRVSGHDGAFKRWSQYTFAVFNIEQGIDTGDICVAKTCIAIALKCSENAGEVTSTGSFYRIGTKKPIVFKLEDTKYGTLDEDGQQIGTDSLKQHGMQLISLYL